MARPPTCLGRPPHGRAALRPGTPEHTANPPEIETRCRDRVPPNVVGRRPTIGSLRGGWYTGVGRLFAEVLPRRAATADNS